MTSNRGYTTATKVRDAMADQIHTSFADADIEACINRMEGIIDARMRIGGSTGAFSFTWATAKSPHWAVEMAATYGTALMLCGASAASWNTLEQLVNAQNTFSYLLKLAMDTLEDESSGAFILDQ